MKKYFLALCTFLLIIMFVACDVSEDAIFSGSKTGNENHFEISFDFLNTTFTHELKMKQGEIILVHIEKESGDIKVMIQKDEETPIYEGNGEVATDFSVDILEDGTYTVSVTGKKAKGLVKFSRKL